MDIIHLDRAYNGDQYVCHFVDDCTSYHSIYTMPMKGAVNTAIRYYVAIIYNKYNLTL